MVDELVMEDLVEAAAAQDEAAWQRLWAAIEPPLARIVAQPRFLGRLGQREDDRRNIVVAVMARLRADRFHRLQLYLDAKRANPRLRFIELAARRREARRHRLPARAPGLRAPARRGPRAARRVDRRRARCRPRASSPASARR